MDGSTTEHQDKIMKLDLGSVDSVTRTGATLQSEMGTARAMSN